MSSRLDASCACFHTHERVRPDLTRLTPLLLHPCIKGSPALHPLPSPLFPFLTHSLPVKSLSQSDLTADQAPRATVMVTAGETPPDTSPLQATAARSPPKLTVDVGTDEGGEGEGAGENQKHGGVQTVGGDGGSGEGGVGKGEAAGEGAAAPTRTVSSKGEEKKGYEVEQTKLLLKPGEKMKVRMHVMPSYGMI